jgi:hypothetical protein
MGGGAGKLASGTLYAPAAVALGAGALELEALAEGVSGAPASVGGTSFEERQLGARARTKERRHARLIAGGA